MPGNHLVSVVDNVIWWNSENVMFPSVTYRSTFVEFTTAVSSMDGSQLANQGSLVFGLDYSCRSEWWSQCDADLEMD